MHSYTVTIGRGAGDRTLDPQVWAGFELRVQILLMFYVFHTDDFVETHRGIGAWDGKLEESTKVALFKSSPLEEKALEQIRHELSMLASTYHQDMIAFSIGVSELIEPSGV